MYDDLLLPMYEDGHYCDTLIDKVKTVLIDFAIQVDKTTKSDAIYGFARDAIHKINRLKPLFEEQDCHLDDIAADYVAEAIMMIVESSGYFDFDISFPNEINM